MGFTFTVVRDAVRNAPPELRTRGRSLLADLIVASIGTGLGVQQVPLPNGDVLVNVYGPGDDTDLRRIAESAGISVQNLLPGVCDES